ncbi:MAG: aminoacyl-tRNA hydrolase [bacterium]|jgi:PTH1 family peptidyl-tRNA hydrolase
MKIITGLGNPGLAYVNTRHNAGFAVVDLLANTYGIKVDEWKYESFLGRGRIAREPVVLLKPQTYMNLSGRAVRQVLQGLGAGPDELLVIHDDLDLPFGRLRLRLRGGPGGHNGIKSIISALETEEFARLRFGIGRPPAGGDPADYVLEEFTAAERELFDLATDKAGAAVCAVLAEGVTAAMNRFNRADKPAAEEDINE